MQHPAYSTMITDHLIAWPITRLIDKSAELDGIDTKDAARRLLAEGCSAFMGILCSPLGGPVAFVAGLLGYCIGTGAKKAGGEGGQNGSSYDDPFDPAPDEYRAAGIRASERLGDMLPDDLGERIGDSLIDYGRRHRNVRYSTFEVTKKVYDIIFRIDRKAANLWVALLYDELS